MSIKILGRMPIEAIEAHWDVPSKPSAETELIMVERWWPVLEHAVEALDSGGIPLPVGAGRKLKAPAHMYSLFDDDPDHIEPWSPGKEARHRDYHAERLIESGENDPTSRLLLKVRGLPDLFVALDFIRKHGGPHGEAAKDMLEQWLDGR